MNIMNKQLCALFLTVALLGVSLVNAQDAAISKITQSSPVVTKPSLDARHDNTHYGVGSIVQLDSKNAALFCNLKVSVPHHIDHEDGVDAYVFSSIAEIGKQKPLVVTRNEKDCFSKDERFFHKFPAGVGFWPLGAMGKNNENHPGAGKGFAVCQALSMPGSGDKVVYAMYRETKYYLEIMQLEFDGSKLTITERQIVERGDDCFTTDNGWAVISTGMSSAMPDSDDLLLAVSAFSKKEKIRRTGVCRFRFKEGRWQPVVFTPVAEGSEPSLTRRSDGKLFFTTRTRDKNRSDESSESINIWSSACAEGAWVLYLSEGNQRSEAPLSINATTDGIIFVLANPVGITSVDGQRTWMEIRRARLALWQLSNNSERFMPSRPQLIRDATTEFERIKKTHWFLDHPTTAVVQLDDGLWHCLVTYRVTTASYPAPAERATFPLVSTEHHGCYVEEITTKQPKLPLWSFINIGD